VYDVRNQGQEYQAELIIRKGTFFKRVVSIPLHKTKYSWPTYLVLNKHNAVIFSLMAVFGMSDCHLLNGLKLAKLLSSGQKKLMDV